MGRLELDIVDAEGKRLTEPVSVALICLQDQKVRRLDRIDPRLRIVIARLRSGGMYSIAIMARSYQTVQQHVLIPTSGVLRKRVALPIEPSRARAVFPRYEQLDVRLQELLNRSPDVGGYEGRTGNDLYLSLNDEAKAGLLNTITLLLSSTELGKLAEVDELVLVDIRRSGCVLEVPPTRIELARLLAQDGTVRSGPAYLVRPLRGFVPAEAFKTRHGLINLQLTFFNSGDRWLVAIEVDDTAQLGHLFQVVRNRATGRGSHAYDTHQFLTAHGLDPGYRLAPRVNDQADVGAFPSGEPHSESPSSANPPALPSSPVAPPQSAGARSTTVPELDDVKCSVFTPHSVCAGDSTLVQVFAHLETDEGEADRLAKAYDPAATVKGASVLTTQIERGTHLTFALDIPGAVVDQSVQVLTWRGAPESVQFGVAIPLEHAAGNLIGTVSVIYGSVPIGRVKFVLQIVSAQPAMASDISSPQQSWKRYRYAFISYASADRAEVLKRVQMLDTVSIEFFQDLLSLEPGERWAKALFKNIDKSDVFFLFWSSAAKKSEWVLKEVRYALECQAGDELALPEIVPVVIEGPPVVPPPEELRDLHFNDRFLYFIAGSQPSAK